MRRLIASLVALGIIGLGFGMMSPRAHANVTISQFSAKWQSDKVAVEWKTGTEKDFIGYNILRSESASGPFSKIRYESRPECMLQITGCQYLFADGEVTRGKTYYYQLESVNVSNQTQRHSVTAIAQAPTAPTATATAQVPATLTATPTRTPTRTATLAPGAPTSTPAPPTATFAPPTATPLPQFTPTRTATLRPGVTPPTPVPPTPTVRVAYAVQPTATRASAPALAPTVAPVEPTRVALAIKDAEPETPAEPEEIAAAPDDSDVRVRQLIIGAAVVLFGIMGAGGLALGILAIYLAFRTERNSP